MPASELSAFTHVFRADIAAAIRRPRVNKRARRPVSCVPCRTRKLKCDRQHPVCGGCQRRRDAAACKWDLPPGAVFASPGTIGSTEDGGTPGSARVAPGSTKKEMQVRLQRLEEMIGGLVGDERGAVGGLPQSSSSSGSPATTTGTTVSSPAQRSNTYHTGGHLSTSGTEMRFVGATHWAAVLESLHEIQGYLADADAEPGVDVEMGDEPARAPSPEPWREEPDLLFGAMEPISIRDIMTALPSRLKTDQMLGVYDQGRFTQTPILHTRQFRRQYEAFWLSPYTTSLLWISILFSALATAVLSDMDVIGQDAAFAQKRLFTNKAMQCLLAGEYLKAKPFAVEALLSYTLTRLTESTEANPYLWSAFGLAARLAQRMGYHRDVAHITPAGGRPRVTPFQAEMRRRVWFGIEAFDVMFSFQLGMPTIIQPDQCDVAPPRNLHDEDFDEDTVVLPPSRPETEPTKALYYRYKCRLIRQLRRIMLHALGVSTPDYEETLSLHAELEATHAGIPPSLRFVRFRDAGPNMETKTILHNMALEIMYLKALCILHRPYLTRRKGDPACELSRRSCRQAALKILELHADMEVEVKLDGKLFEKGYLLSNLTTHDFLIAAMVLCLDLNESIDLAPEDREIEIFALQATYANWSKRRPKSRDAAHATKVLGAMLKVSNSAKPITTPTNHPAAPPQPPKRTSNLRHLLEPVPEPIPSQPPRPTLSLGPELVRFGNSAMAFQNKGLLANVGAMMDLPDWQVQDEEDGFEGLIEGDVDWNALDSYIMDQEMDLGLGLHMVQQPGDLDMSMGQSTAERDMGMTQQLSNTHGDMDIDPSLNMHGYGNVPGMLGSSFSASGNERAPQTGTGTRHGFSVGDLMN